MVEIGMIEEVAMKTVWPPEAKRLHAVACEELR